MAIAVALVGYFPQSNPQFAIIQMTFTGNYATGGDTVNLNPATWSDPNGVGVIGYPGNPTKTNPSIIDTSYTGASVGGYADFVPGATLATYLLQQFVPGGSELGAGAYPAGILNKTAQASIPLF